MPLTATPLLLESNALQIEFGLFAVTQDGTVYERISQTTWVPVLSVPVASPPVALVPYSRPSGAGQGFYVFTENGTVFDCYLGGGCTSSVVFGGPVQSRSSSWGSIKASGR